MCLLIYMMSQYGIYIMGGGFGPGLPKSVRQRQRSCLFGRDLRSLWQTDFAPPDDAVYDWMCFVLRLEVVS